jgi:hypothetical protein
MESFDPFLPKNYLVEPKSRQHRHCASHKSNANRNRKAGEECCPRPANSEQLEECGKK